VAEAAGVKRVGVFERLQRHYPHFQKSREGESVLIAGCGSGHQVAVTLKMFDASRVVAVDLSAAALAYADRRLRRAVAEDMHKVSLAVADITLLSLRHLGPLAPPAGFDLVCCGGVLHHTPDPTATLKNLARLTAPGGVIQLATYSKINTQSWQPAAKSLVAELVGGVSSPPRDAAVRALRKAIASIKDDQGKHVAVANALTSAPEFYSTAGVRDLVFHPLETSFALPEVGEMATSAGLDLVGVFFPTLDADAKWRQL